MKYYNFDILEVEKQLKVDEKGLTSEEAKKRLEQYGFNIIPEKKKDSIFLLFFHELKDPIVILLIMASFASFLAQEVIDGFAILFITLVDAILGTYQEWKANNTAEALKQLIALKTKVIRDNKTTLIPSEQLTIGDFVLLESGDKIAADLRIVESHNLMVDESVLTGESIQVRKSEEKILKDNVSISEQYNMLFSGTSVVKGRAKGIVIATGSQTEIGKIADSINQTKEEKSPLTIRVEKLSKQISFLVLCIAIVITFLLIMKQIPYHEIFLSVVALAVSAMPEGLSLALTMALTIASNKMAKKQVIVRKLNSVESLGSCTVIASDKTGTLTVNEQMAKKILLPNGNSYDISGVGYHFEGEVLGENIEDAQKLALYGVLNNEAKILGDKKIGDSIDLAFLVLGKKLKVDTSDITVLEQIPYESENQYSSVFYEQNNEVFCTVKGSFEKVKEFCNIVDDETYWESLFKQNEFLAEEGYRVIALATGKVKKQKKYGIEDIKNLSFVGMVGFIDPIRSEAVYSIEECHNAGIKVLMITGDHPLTAFSIAKDLQLVSDKSYVTTGEEVDLYLKKGFEAFDEFVKSKIVFSRVTPLQKLEIVNSFKRQGEFVAVTGNGVNDAPAIQSANIGIAMGSGTDIARETSNMIIMDDNFKSIIAGVLEGRVAYANIRKIIFFLISCGLAEVLFFCLAILFDMPMPLLAIQLLWLNVVTDGIQDLALSFEKAEPNIMKENPRSPKEPLFDSSLFQEILFSGIMIGFLVFILWYFLIKKLNMDVVIARGYVMAFMVFIQNIHVFNCRSEKRSAFQVSLKSNRFIVIGVFLSILLQFIVMEVPFLSSLLQTSSLPIWHLVSLFLFALSILFIMECYKKFKYRNKE